ncbi:hypothetical protein T552_03187 [Pneumocystis carinii B80]|uniref:Squalene monooxygenase n=1 Tax=Pneumocystis carinii (strain B80) TaxID=1408658 RepID=A0A0W4ZC12_PNEC8|nr:hypothetical protein T552_03187 [Pneumocystis carinii B80]KTW25913.1 hypothetical protein T552_03187 [Pneumocystis carinii B80]
MHEWDCIIVGAGASLATVFGRQKRKTLLLERNVSEPDRIVGELLQPGGIKALEALGIEDAVEGIDAIHVKGYQLLWNNESVNIPYVNKKSSYHKHISYQGRSFHHGRFVMKLRQHAVANESVTMIESTVLDVIENPLTQQVLGVKAFIKATQQYEHYFAPLVVIADGCFSKFRKQFISKPVIIKSNFVGLILENVTLPMPFYGHVILSNRSPILMYQLSTHHTRILIDLPGKLPSNTTGELKKYLKEVITPILPKNIQSSFIDALDNQKIRSMPNCFLPPSLNTKPGLIILGDAMNMRHPLTGGGMTVALNDAVLLSDLLSPSSVPSFQDTDLVLHKMFIFHWKRKKFSAVINILAQILYFLFSPTDIYLNILQKGCFKYFQLGGIAISGPISLLSGFVLNSLFFYQS